MGAWEEIVDYTVPSNTTSVTLNNFGTITKDDFIRVVMTHNSTGTEIGLFVNGNTTASNYYMQFLAGNGTSVIATRANKNQIDFTPSGSSDVINCYLKLSENDNLNIFALNSRSGDSGLNLQFHYNTSTSSFNSITEFNFVATTGSSIGANSRIQIYKLAAEKVADVVVTANTTQVDITGLDIKKGDEYLLVSDLKASSSGTGSNLFINDNITPSNYYLQFMLGVGSTAAAGRLNNAAYNNNQNNQSSLSYAHIKLSNIGAYTFQNYELRNYGTSNPALINSFSSSTAENITSINKINIRSNSTNQIIVGSRYELYKLYEGGN